MGDKFSKFRGGGGRDDCDCEDDDCNGENGSDDDLFDSEDLENPTLPDGFERPDLFVIPMPGKRRCDPAKAALRLTLTTLHSPPYTHHTTMTLSL
jgi:hypothetical protein